MISLTKMIVLWLHDTAKTALIYTLTAVYILICFTKPTMRICYIGDGDSIHNQFMIDWFARAGHDVLFLTDTPDQIKNCEVIQVAPRHGFKYMRHLYATYNVRKAIKLWKPDVVHAHNLTGYGYWGGLCGFHPLVMTAWGTDVNVYPDMNPIFRFLIRYSLLKAELITADAVALCETTRTLIDSDREVRLHQWGVDLRQFDCPISNEIQSKAREDAEFVLISNRRLRELYNIDKIIKAFAKALPQMHRAKLIVVGDDIQSDELKALADALNITNHVWFTGWTEHQEMLDALRSSDVYISIPKTDSTALSLLEAMAAGLPVITGDLEANHEWIEHQKSGLLVEPGNVDALAEAMVWMFQHQDEIKQWGNTNRHIVEERGNRETEMKQLEAWYITLVQQSL
jgi:glycosyltransferase involved in cell wall biosynthesis